MVLSISTRNFHQASSWSGERSIPCMTDGWFCFSHKQSPGWSLHANSMEVLSNHNSHWAGIQHSSASGTLEFAGINSIRISELSLMSRFKVANIQHLSVFASLSRTLLKSVLGSCKRVWRWAKRSVGWFVITFSFIRSQQLSYLCWGKIRSLDLLYIWNTMKPTHWFLLYQH